MKYPHCGQEHPDELIDCPETGKKIKRACVNPGCPFYGEYLFPLDYVTCPCCGKSLLYENGHEFVDLGLSVKWATCNIGAEKPEECGDFFAWGETKPKSYYDWSNLKYCNDATNLHFSKYKCNGRKRDNRTTLELEDDAAHANWGGGWRMPTSKEFEELKYKCTWKWITMNGEEGYKVTSKKNGNSIFLPAANYYRYTFFRSSSHYGDYWSSSLDDRYSYYARALRLDSDDYSVKNRHRADGMSVRPVLRKYP